MKIEYDNGVPQTQKISDKWPLTFSLFPYEAIGATELASQQNKYTASYKL